MATEAPARPAKTTGAKGPASGAKTNRGEKKAAAGSKSKTAANKAALITAVDGPWSVAVDVYLKSDGRSPDFKVESFLQSKVGGDLVFHNHGRPGFNVIFHLHDQTGSGYRFPDDKDKREAVWSRYGDICPRTEVFDVFTARTVFNDGKTLVAFNENPKPAKGAFKYTLRVTMDGGESYLPLDPGGVNQNGGF